jgi:hypothetical protein
LHPGFQLVKIRPDTFKPQVCALELLPGGKMLVVTWRGSSYENGKFGEAFILEGIKGADASQATFRKIATGFKDAMGAAVVNGEIYIGDIDRIVKLVDKDGDGVYETHQEVGKLPAYGGWFEYSFGPVYKDGKFYMAMAGNFDLSGTAEKQLGPDRHVVLAMGMDGRYEVLAGGIRSPDGIGLGPRNEVFITDNQGAWRPASMLIHVKAGRNYGYRALSATPLVDKPVSPPAIWIPFGEANDSPTEPFLMNKGTYAGQFFYGDIGRGGLYRAFVEEVKDPATGAMEYQGACFPFSGGFEVGIHRIRIDDDGDIFVGGLGTGSQSNQGWNGKTFGLQKLVANGKVIFEILAVRARKGGMELEFTKPVADISGLAERYAVRQWHYSPTADYGGPKVGTETVPIQSVQVSPDKMKVFLRMDGLKKNKVVHIRTTGLKSAQGDTSWIKETWYTLNNFSETPPFTPPAALERATPAQPDRLDLAVRVSRRFAEITASGSGPLTLTITDWQGRQRVVSSLVAGKTYRYDKNSIPPGMLILRVSNGRSFQVRSMAFLGQ